QNFRWHDSATESKTVGQQTRQPSRNNFFAGLVDRVANTTLLDQIFIGVVDAIGGAPITITRLADAAGVNKIFFAKFDVNLFLLSAAGALVPNKSASNMGVTKKTNGGVLISEAVGGIEIAKDVEPLPWSIAGGCYDGEIGHP